jgi:hypothetical protein
MSSFERLKPAAVAPDAGASGTGPLGRVTLDSRKSGASVFRDFGGGDGDGNGGTTESDPRATEAAEAPAVDEAQHAAEAAYADGVAAGRHAAMTELVGEGEAFVKAIEELKRFRVAALERYQGDLLALALGIARKVVQRELAEHPEHWLGMFREAGRHALDRE